MSLDPKAATPPATREAGGPASTASGDTTQLSIGPSGERSIVELATTAPALFPKAGALPQTLAIHRQPNILELATTAPSTSPSLTAPSLCRSSLADNGSNNSPLCDPLPSPHFGQTYDNDTNNARELGRGGIGRVVLVFDRTLGRDVAMKELLPELLEQEACPTAQDASLTSRFLREARITGQLEHPNIVPVYELGKAPNGHLYYTMRVVRGRTLSSAIEAGKTLTQRLTLVNHFAGLCQAIAYAHSRGVLHRDIKPDNVMIGEFGETFVLDWGLAKIVEESGTNSLRAAASLSRPPAIPRRDPALAMGNAETFRTQLGNIVGTPLYMSPEQILQTPEASNPTIDVWSLGVVLHFILTGELPFSGKTLNELVSNILTVGPADILTSCPEAPRDLVAVAVRALAKDPRSRYPSARELVRDIAAYQAGEKVTAYEYGSVELLSRFVRRNRAAVTIATTAICALGALFYTSYRDVSAARDQALASERRAVFGEQQAKTRLSDILFERARQSMTDGDSANSTLLAAGALALMERADARGVLIAQTNTERLEPGVLPAAAQDCKDALWNANQQQLACRKGSLLSLSRGNDSVDISDLPLEKSRLVSLNAEGWLLILPDSKTLQLRPDLSRQQWNAGPNPKGELAASADGRTLIRLDEQGAVEIWDTTVPRVIVTAKLQQQITALAIHPTEPLLALGGYRGDILLWRWTQEAQPITLGHARATVHALAFAPRGNHLISGGADRAVLLWDTKQLQLSLMPLRAESSVTSLAWSNDAAWIAVGTKTTGIDLIDTQRYERALRTTSERASVQQLWFSTQNDIVGTLSGGSAFRFTLKKSHPPPRFTSRGNVLCLAWSAPGERLLIGGLGDKGLCHLLLAEATCADRLPLRLGLVRKIVLSSNGAHIVLGGTGGKLELWDARQKLPLGYIDVPIPEIRDVVFINDDSRLLAIGTASLIAELDIKTMKVEATYPLPAAAQSFALLPKTNRLLLGLRDGTVARWSLGSHLLERFLGEDKGWVTGVAASERDNWALALLEDGNLVRLALDTLKEQSRTKIHGGRPTTLAYSERLGLVAVGGEDRKVTLLEPSDPPRVLATLEEHQGTVRALTFDEANTRLVSAGDDGMVRLWDLRHLRTSAAELRRAIETQYRLKLDAGNIVSTEPVRLPP